MEKTFSIKFAWYALIVLISALPMTVLLVWTAYKSHSIMLESAFLKEAIYIEGIKSKVNGEIDRLLTMLHNKSDPIAYTLERDRDDDLLIMLSKTILSRERDIHGIYIFDKNSQPILGVDKQSGTGQLNISLHQELFEYEYDLGEGHKFDPESPSLVIPLHGRNYIGNPGMHEGEMSFDIVVPIGPRDSPLGALVARINIGELWTALDLESSRPEADSYIVDNRGSLLSEPPPGSRYMQRDILTQLQIVRSLIISEEHKQTDSYEGLKGIPVFGIGAQIETVNWAVISEIPVSVITKPIQKEVYGIIFIGSLFIIIFGWLGLSISRRMLNPIRGLSLAFDRARDGDYSASVPTSFIREINTLAEGFNYMISDIHIREKALRESEERFKRLSEAAFEGICITDKGKLLDMNQTFADMFGYDCPELIGTSVINLVALEYRDLVSKNISSEYEKLYEVLSVRKDKSTFHVEIQAKHAYFEGRKVRVTAVRDITERKKAEEELRKTNRALQMLSDCNQILVRAKNEQELLNDVCRIIVEIGEYRLAWVGLAEQNEEKTVRVVAQYGFEDGYLEKTDITWADTEQGGGPTGTAIRTGAPSVAHDILNDSRFEPWREQALKRGYSSSAAIPMIFDTKVIGAFNIYSTKTHAFDEKEIILLEELADDLSYGIHNLRTRTERKKAERALLESARLLEESQRVAKLGSYAFDATSGMWSGSEILDEIFGITDKDFTRDMEGWLQIVHPEQREEMRSYLMDHVLSKRNKFDKEYRIIRLDDGKELWVHGLGKVVLDENQNPIEMIGTIQDITERKQTEKALQESSRLLEESQRVAKLGSYTFDIASGTWSSSEIMDEICGITDKDFTRDIEGWLQIVHPEQREEMRSYLMDHVLTKRNKFDKEYRIIRLDDGKELWVHALGEIVLDENQNPVKMIGTHQDITERKQAEEEIEHQKTMFESIFNSVADAIVFTDTQRKIVMINPGFTKILGYNPQDVIGKKTDLFYESREVFENLGKERFNLNAEEKLKPYIVSYKRKDGMVFSGETLGTIIRDRSGTIIGFLGTIRDITERKRAEQDLEKSEQKSQAIIATVGEGIITIGEGSHILSVNQELCNIFGYSAKELQDKDITILIPGKYLSDHIKGMENYLKGGKPKILGRRVEVEGLRKNGSIFPMELRIEETMLRLSGKRLFTAAIRDISDRKDAEKTLRKLNNAIEQAAEGVLITNLEGIVEYANPAVEKITGYSPEEIIGQNPRVLKSGEQKEGFYTEMWDTIKSGKVWRGEVVNKRRSGELYEEDMTISPVVDNDGNITNFVAIKRDISKEKGLQKQLIQAEKLSSIGTFVSGVAHELNNPLTAILGFSEMLISRKLSDSETKENLQIIATQAKRTSAIVKNLLKFSRKHEEGKSLINVNIVLEDTLKLHEYRLRTDNIEIKRNFEENLPTVLGNSGQLQQVFLNIIMNAHHAMLEVHGKGIIVASIYVEDNEVIITLENNGPTIPPDKLKSIFDPFFTTKEAGEGTGLGMYISFGIIQDHYGRIWVENLSNSGVMFTIALPIHSIEKREKEKKERKKEETRGSKKQADILIVDDEDSIREWLGQILIDEGFSVVPARNGREAIDILQDRDFDIIISDMKMPEVDGLELGRWLQSNKPEYLGKFFIATGAVDKEIDDWSEKYGWTIIEKPFDRKDILKAINKALK